MFGIVRKNTVHCPFCDSDKHRLSDYKLTEVGTQITGICTTCNREFEYYVKLKLDENIRWV